MQFSLFFFTEKWPDEPGDHYRLLRECAQLGDRSGFTAVWVPERHFNPFGGLYPTPSVVAASLASLTERIALRAGSVVLPLGDPLRVAEEWSVVDNLSQGRVGIAFASGWHVNDFVLAPDHYESRREVMYRDIEKVRRLWRGESLRLRNGAGNEVDVRIYPRPFQREIPIWLTAQSDGTFRKAGEMGANVLTNMNYHAVSELAEKIALYRGARRAAGHGPGHVTLMVHTFVASPADIERKAKPAYAEYLLTNLDLQSERAQGMGLDVDATEEDKRFIISRAVDRMMDEAGLIGTPEVCAERAAQAKQLGVDEIACLVDFGVDREGVLASLGEVARIRERLG